MAHSLRQLFVLPHRPLWRFQIINYAGVPQVVNSRLLPGELLEDAANELGKRAGAINSAALIREDWVALAQLVFFDVGGQSLG